MAILRADPECRRKWLRRYLAMAIAILAIVLWGAPALKEYLDEGEPADAIRLVQILLFLVFASTLPMAYYLYRVAKRIQSDGRFPPAGMNVIRDTEILEGVRARRHATLLLAASVLIAVAALIGMTCLPYLVGKPGVRAGLQQGVGVGGYSAWQRSGRLC